MSNVFTRAESAATAVALLLAVLTGASIGFADPAPLIERGFNVALAEAPPGTLQMVPTPAIGSEAYWLRQRYASNEQPNGRLEPVLWTTPVVAGEKIVIGTGKGQRILEVISVEEIETPSTRLDMASGSDRRFVVTCRNASSADERILRFEIVAEKASGTGPAKRPGHNL
jgi:hypothetical protein